ncbi:MAG: ribonuclease, partial [Candidatus Electrothrix sp. AR3]|nr:ribonuclease [Candidatus Electrothrix sp. AR3]
MTKQNEQKSFILDTNVILHDSSCIEHFDEHDIIVPITVLEELDHFKKGNQAINFHAREFVRSLDNLSANKLFNSGVSIGEGKGRLTIKLEQELHPDLRRHFPSSAKPDHQILNTSYHLYKKDSSRSFILVTKDVNLRMKARAVGLMAENYTNDHIKDLGGLYTGSRIVEESPYGLIDALHSGEEITADKLELPPENSLTSNEFVILHEGNKSALATNQTEDNKIGIVRKQKVCGILPRNAEQTFAVHALC